MKPTLFRAKPAVLFLVYVGVFLIFALFPLVLRAQTLSPTLTISAPAAVEEGGTATISWSVQRGAGMSCRVEKLYTRPPSVTLRLIETVATFVPDSSGNYTGTQSGVLLSYPTDGAPNRQLTFRIACQSGSQQFTKSVDVRLASFTLTANKTVLSPAVSEAVITAGAFNGSGCALRVGATVLRTVVSATVNNSISTASPPPSSHTYIPPSSLTNGNVVATLTCTTPAVSKTLTIAVKANVVLSLTPLPALVKVGDTTPRAVRYDISNASKDNVHLPGCMVRGPVSSWQPTITIPSATLAQYTAGETVSVSGTLVYPHVPSGGGSETYTLTCPRPQGAPATGGSFQGSVTATAKIISVLASLNGASSAGIVEEGKPLSLDWRAFNTTSCLIKGPKGFSHSSTNPTGSVSIGPLSFNDPAFVGGKGTYTIDCASSLGPVQKKLEVTVVPVAYASLLNTSNNIVWEVRNITSCTLTGGGTTVSNITNTNQPTGSVPARADSTVDTTYTLSCTAPAGTISKQVTVPKLIIGTNFMSMMRSTVNYYIEYIRSAYYITKPTCNADTSECRNMVKRSGLFTATPVGTGQGLVGSTVYENFNVGSPSATTYAGSFPANGAGRGVLLEWVCHARTDTMTRNCGTICTGWDNPGGSTVEFSNSYSITGPSGVVASGSGFPMTGSALVYPSTSNSSYTLSCRGPRPSTITLNLAPAGTMVSVSVSAPAGDAAAAEVASGQTADTGRIVFSRTGSLVSALPITFTLGGSATRPGVTGADYATTPVISTTPSITIPAGSSSVTLAITPVDDAVTEPAETVSVVPLGSGAYGVSGPGAVVTIADNDSDLCPNIPGNQASVPVNGVRNADGTCSCNTGYNLSGSSCVSNGDRCTNMVGMQSSIPPNCNDSNNDRICSADPGYMISGDQCLPLLSAVSINSFYADPSRVREGDSVTLRWNVAGLVGGNTCAITSPSRGTLLSFDSTRAIGSQSSGAIMARREFTLSCASAPTPVTRTIVVPLIPAYEEQ